MKHLIALCLLGLLTLAVPACAQQDSSTAKGQSAPAQSTSERQPLPAPTSNDFWDGDEPNFSNLVTHPFANKDYVRRHTEPIRDRINELDQLTSENGRSIKDTDSRAQQGLQLVSEKTSLADQHASDAQSKAQAAQTTAAEASNRVSAAERAVQNLDQYRGASQAEIRFRPGQSVLSKDAKDALDQMAAALKDQRSYIIEVHGFSAGRGQTAMANSQRMADSVVRYLVLNHQIPVYRISVMSMGNAPGQAVGNAAKHGSGGRVEVSVLHNDSINAAK